MMQRAGGGKAWSIDSGSLRFIFAISAVLPFYVPISVVRWECNFDFRQAGIGAIKQLFLLLPSVGFGKVRKTLLK